jgi:hypothetical protein
MKLILQIALGVFIAELAMHEIINFQGSQAGTHAASSSTAASAGSLPMPAALTVSPVAAAPVAASAPAVAACSHEEINGKTYNCCLESQRDPTVRSCAAIPNR